MIHKVLIERQAQKQLAKIKGTAYSLLKTAILKLADNPRPHGYKKLKGRNAYRIREGNYRVIYEIKDKILTVIVITIGHRKDIYKL
ncbi:MAG: type II toxin-antitoxin system RelE/ParE family toxin [Flavobacteriales bacterium]|nr:type II toxin-antitoxin system RelE/ParE family toxin [Flavobacteriales bacterium]